MVDGEIVINSKELHWRKVLIVSNLFMNRLKHLNVHGNNISTIHSYNRRKVKEDIPKYGKAVGTGTLIIGISLVLGFIVSFWSVETMGCVILPAVVVGLCFMLYGQIKYNMGILV